MISSFCLLQFLYLRLRQEHFIHFSLNLDPYVKIYLLHKDQRISKKKTHVKKRTLNPVFNESFVFDLPRTDNGLADLQLEFALLDWDRVTKNEVTVMLSLESFSIHNLDFIL